MPFNSVLVHSKSAITVSLFSYSSFQNQNNLHIGLTSSNGTIYEFDVKGLVKTPFNNRTVALKDESWDQCLVIAQVPESWYDRWDEVLEQISTDQSWSEETYEKDSHNCYSFVLGFLQALEYGEFSALCHDKYGAECLHMVSSRLNRALFSDCCSVRRSWLPRHKMLLSTSPFIASFKDAIISPKNRNEKLWTDSSNKKLTVIRKPYFYVELSEALYYLL